MKISFYITIFLIIISCKSAYAQLPIVNGFTQFTPSVDSRIIYVSNTNGNDATAQFYLPSDVSIGTDVFHPTGTIQPYQTLTAAIAQLRTGYPDWILLQKGDTFINQNFGTLNLSGRNINEPLLIGSYGLATIRPTIFTGNQGLISFFGSASFIAITGLHALPHTRLGTDEPVALNILNAPFQYFLLEDCYFDQFSSHIVAQDYTGLPDYTHVNFYARKNILVNGYKTGGNSSGVFMHRIDSIFFEDNLLDHNGWNTSVAGAGANAFSHNTYFHPSCGFLYFSKNIVSRASATGIGARCGGVIYDNLMLSNPRNMIIGSFDPAQINWPTEGAEGEVSYNVVLDARVESFDAGNGISIERARNVNIHHNIIAHFTMLSNYNLGLSMNRIEDIYVHKNIIYEWGNNQSSGFDFSSGLLLGTDKLGTIMVDSNDVQMENLQGYCVNTNGSFTNISFNGNRYHNIIAASDWFHAGNHATWVSNSGETNSITVEMFYTDPTRNIDSYLNHIGETGSLQEFIDLRKQMSKDNWNNNFTATIINDYIREGFDMNELANIENEYTTHPLLAYPNPASHVIQLNVTEAVEYSIINLQGKVLQSGFAVSIDVSNIPTGIYFMVTSKGVFKIIRN